MDQYGLNMDSNALLVVGIVVLAYFVLIASFGTYFAKYVKNLNDFFFSGQRFAWWLLLLPTHLRF